MEDPPKQRFLLEEGQFRWSKFREVRLILHPMDE
jgi:hypothetical protein